MVDEINEKEFKEKVLESNGKVLVDFYADWCMPCKMLAPTVEDLAKNRKDVTFYKVNVDNNPNLSREYGIMSIPNLIVFDNGKITNNIVGLVDSSELEEALK